MSLTWCAILFAIGLVLFVVGALFPDRELTKEDGADFEENQNRLNGR